VATNAPGPKNESREVRRVAQHLETIPGDAISESQKGVGRYNQAHKNPEKKKGHEKKNLLQFNHKPEGRGFNEMRGGRGKSKKTRNASLRPGYSSWKT